MRFFIDDWLYLPLLLVVDWYRRGRFCEHREIPGGGSVCRRCFYCVLTSFIPIL